MVDYIDVIANGNFQKMAFNEALTQARCRRLQACQPSPIPIRVAIIYYNFIEVNISLLLKLNEKLKNVS